MTFTNINYLGSNQNQAKMYTCDIMRSVIKAGKICLVQRHGKCESQVDP